MDFYNNLNRMILYIENNLDEEIDYQKFLVKAMKAGKEFVDDYNNLSEQNKIRFHKDLEKQIIDDSIINAFINDLKNKSQIIYAAKDAID